MIKKLISILLLGAMCLTLFAACNNGSPDESHTTAQTTEQKPLTVIENGKTDFLVVYNNWEIANDETLQKKLDSMFDMIQKRTGVKIKTASSTGHTPDPNAYEIYIGNTGLAETLEVEKDLRTKDYAVVRKGNKIVIAGGNKTMLSSAITYFTSKVVAAQTKDDASLVIFGVDQEIIFRAVYTHDTYLIGGKSIADFTIVIPDDYNAGEHQFAYYLRSAIINHTGYDLAVETDKKEFENEILIGKTKRSTLSPTTTAYEIKVDGGKVQIAAGCTTAYGYLEVIMGKMIEKSNELSSQTGDTKASYEAINDSILQKTGDLRIIFHNILSYVPDGADSLPNPKLRWNMKANIYVDYQADIVCLQEFNEKPRGSGKDSLKTLMTAKGFAEVPYDPALDGDTPIFYKPDRVELLKYGTFVYKTPNNDNERYGGYAKMLIWGVFKEKSTGKIFAVCSAHLDHQDNAEANARRASEALEILDLINNTICTGEYKNIPVILGGDINTSYNRENNKYGHTGAMTNFVNVGGFTNVQKTFAGADKTCSWSNPPVYDDETCIMMPGAHTASPDDSIDHCIYKGGVTPTLFDVLDDKYTRKTSDHLPLVVDFQFN